MAFTALLLTLLSRSLSSRAFLVHPKAEIQRTWLQATPVENESPITNVETAERTFTCDFCKTKFDSRNAIFRHLRADGCSLEDPRRPSDTPQNPMVKQSIAIQFGYVGSKEGKALNEWAGLQVLNAVQDILDQTRHSLDFQLQARRTQSSVARLRSPILTQDADCHAARDVLVLTGTCLQSALPELERVLEEELPSSLGSIRIWACKLLWPNSKVSIHAERSCTQMVYQYLVPLAWLPDAELLQHHWKGWKENPPTDSLRRFKAALRCVESSMVSGGDPNVKVAAGRFGRLGAKERRAWHNFADPTLRGKASPSQEPVWRVVDVCRMVGMVNFGKEDAAMVVEVKGDAFVPQQVRRIVGTALAIAHGWLPENIWNSALLDPACVMETVLAPPSRLLLADCRFHFEESRTSGTALFESDICGKVLGNGKNEGKKAATWAAKQILKRLSTDAVREAEHRWLQVVHDNTSPRIRESLQSSSFQKTNARLDDLAPAPKEYEAVLQHLRDIVAEGKWPDTSVARSSVIRRQHSKSAGKTGSFTVVNPKVLDKMEENIDLPLGNQLFPELVDAVFELENVVSDQAKRVQDDSGRIEVSTDCTTRRPQSSHCAINAQAQFTPHVDSGRGAGQSLSIIVGLGDYCQGELLVEGLPCDIRFQPLEFNGWTLRHWTNPYEGERFSLVWFTPEVKG